MNDNNTLADDLRSDLEDERKSSLALMKLLADEKRKSEALAADKADLVRVLGVADERIKTLEALNSRLANDINCGELLPQSERNGEPK